MREFQSMNSSFLDDRTTWNKINIIRITKSSPGPDPNLVLIRSESKSKIFNRTFRPRKHARPWFTPELRRLKASRDKAWRSFRGSRGLQERQRYRTLRNRFKTAVRDAMRSYYRAEIEGCVSVAERWRTLRRLGLGSGPRSAAGLPVSVDELNEFFVGPPDGRAMVGARPVSRDVPYEKFSFRYVEPVEVVEAIARTRTDARGTDGIPVSSLRDCLIVILPVLLHIFDCSLQTGVFPTAWKSALVRPVPKIGLPRAAADFRPISLLCGIKGE
ncbi:unnamed protein product [Trichogramma brassicae]|uniref:Reverse transcriptase domain-containing protein n=1 Tax=Trichogramma brassicae TaxID=86971 RepID=A0A6H5HZI8_9HYME|nr:unnamed protein product [Trichogramma brassicae]